MSISTTDVVRLLGRQIDQPMMNWCIGNQAVEHAKAFVKGYWFDSLGSQEMLKMYISDVSANVNVGFDSDVFIKRIEGQLFIADIDVLAAKMFKHVYVWFDLNLSLGENLVIVDRISHLLSRKIGRESYELVLVDNTLLKKERELQKLN